MALYLFDKIKLCLAVSYFYCIFVCMKTATFNIHTRLVFGCGASIVNMLSIEMDMIVGKYKNIINNRRTLYFGIAGWYEQRQPFNGIIQTNKHISGIYTHHKNT